MYDYKTAFDFGAAATLEAYPEYAAVQERLVNSELLNYEEKSKKSKIIGRGRIPGTVFIQASGKYEAGTGMSLENSIRH